MKAPLAGLLVVGSLLPSSLAVPRLQGDRTAEAGPKQGLHATVLRLFAWDTEAPVEGWIQVQQLVRSEPSYPGHRPRVTRKYIVRRGKSPLELRPTDPENLDYLVHAKGYAWTPVTLDPRGGERGVLLQPPGHLDVSSVDRRPPGAEVLRVRSANGKLYLEQPFGQRRVRDLPEGVWEVSAESGRLENPRVYGSATVLVAEGETTAVSLVLSRTPHVDLVPIEGTLIVPVEWGLPPSKLVFEGLDAWCTTPERALHVAELEPVEGRPEAFRFHAGGFDPGRYRLTYEGSPLSLYFEVPLRPEGEVLLEMPPPANVSIAVVDAQDGSPVEMRRLLWSIEAPEGWRGATSGGLLPIPRTSDGRFEGRVAQGRVRFRTWVPLRHRDWSAVLPLSAEGLTREVELERRTGLLLVRDRPKLTARSHGPRDLRLEVVRGPDGGKIHQGWTSQREIVFEATLPGTYLVRLLPPEGFAPIPERELVIESGELTTVEVELARQ